MEPRSDHPWGVTLDYHPDIWDGDDGDGGDDDYGVDGGDYDDSGEKWH